MNWRLKLKVLFSFSRRVRETKGTSAPLSWRGFFLQYILGFNKFCYWPAHFTSTISGSNYIHAGIGTAPGLAHGCYIFACKGGEIVIGDYTIIAPNVCIAGYNHNLQDVRITDLKGPVRIGKYSWIGANAVILPGVVLGDHTVVAAGAVVSKSFAEGYCVIGGNPASHLKDIPREGCVEFRNDFAYHGYLRAEEFEVNRNKLITL